MSLSAGFVHVDYETKVNETKATASDLGLANDVNEHAIN